MAFYRQTVLRACVRSSVCVWWGRGLPRADRWAGIWSRGLLWRPVALPAKRSKALRVSAPAASGRSGEWGRSVRPEPWGGFWGELGVGCPSSDPQPCPVYPGAPSSLRLTLVSPFSPLWLLQLVPKLSRNYLKEGYMEKTGPKVGLKHFCNPCRHESRSVRG